SAEVVAGESGDGRFGDDQAGRVDPEVVAAVDQAGQAVHHEAVARGGLDVEHHGPPRSVEVAGPVVVRDDDLAVPGVAAGGHEGAEVVGRGHGRGGSDLVVLVVLSDVVAPLLGRVHAHDVPHVELLPAGTRPFGDALHLLAVFRLDVRPHHASGRFAKEVP